MDNIEAKLQAVQPFLKKCYAEFNKAMHSVGKQYVEMIAKYEGVDKVEWNNDDDHFGFNMTFEKFVFMFNDSFKDLIRNGNINHPNYNTGIGVTMAYIYSSKNAKAVDAYGANLMKEFNGKKLPKHMTVVCGGPRKDNNGNLTRIDVSFGYDIFVGRPELDVLRK